VTATDESLTPEGAPRVDHDPPPSDETRTDDDELVTVSATANHVPDGLAAWGN
jgi:hypothetical protein